MTRREQYLMAVRCAVVSGSLAVVIAALLVADYSTRVTEDPLNSPEYVSLRAQLKAAPQDEALQQSFRELDQRLRESYFNRRNFALWGAWLLLGSTALCAASGKWAATLRRQLPRPVPSAVIDDPDEAINRTGRSAVAVFGGLAAVTAIGLYTGSRNDLPADAEQQAALVSTDSPGTGTSGSQAGTDGTSSSGPSDSAVTPPMATPSEDAASPIKKPVEAKPAEAPASADLPELPAGYPTDEEIRANWPRFRGPYGLGIFPAADVATAWDVETGEGILWKTEVPLPGNNSPVVWGDRVFLTGADEQSREVFCFHAETGELQWRKAVPGTPESTAEVPEVMEATGLAASTAATDGRRVYAMFANGDIGAFDFEGNLRWSRSLGMPKNAYGHATSLVLYQDMVIVQFDQGTRDDELSRLLALNAATGELVWETRREVPNSWPSPIVVQVGEQPQIITCGAPWVIAYAPVDGREIWRAECMQGDVGPSPVYADGMFYAANEFPGLTAIRAGGSGDVTSTHVAWEADLGVPDCCSPLATDKFVFLLASYGILTCYDAKEGGDPLWEQEFDASFVSSPTLVGDLIFLFDEEGKVWVVEPGADECQIVAENSLGENCVTSPAFHNGRMFVRGEQHLICIGKVP